MPFDVVVVGSLNHDITVHAPRHPRPGETILGTGHYAAGGGKGANQAVAASRMGGKVAMIGAVGNDDHGRELTAALASEGIDTTGIKISDQPTGLAVITVDTDAENTIVVSPGANLALAPEDLDNHADKIASAKVVLAQLEVPLETVMKAAVLTRGTFCLNPAPYQPLPPELLAKADILIPNRSELAALSGHVEAVTNEEVLSSAQAIGFQGTVVVTLGDAGAMVVSEDAAVLRVPNVDAADPTGAGDAFCGALAKSLSDGMDVTSAARRATLAGAIAATRLGAQPSIPTAAEVDAFTG